MATQNMLNNLYRQLITEVTTARTLSIGDMGSRIICANAGTTTITIPTNAAAAIPIGAVFELQNFNGGAAALLTIAGVLPINIIGTPVVGPGGRIRLQKIQANTWDCEVFEVFGYSTTLAWNGYTSPAGTVHAIRNNTQVMINFPSITLSGGTPRNGAITTNTVLPARFRPTQDVAQQFADVVLNSVATEARVVCEASSGILYVQSTNAVGIAGTTAIIGSYSLGFAV